MGKGGCACVWAQQQQGRAPGGHSQASTPLPNANEPTPNSNPNSRPAGPPEPATQSQGLESVERLIEELLERAPAGPQPGDLAVQGISIEAFHQELRELEDRVSPHLLNPSQVTSAGPFMAVLFAKLEGMLQNSLYVNILLTGILAQLACHPQPLLRSFLLNTNMVFQPSVKSLIQVLGSVKNRIEAFAATQEEFPAMLRRARCGTWWPGENWTGATRPAACPTCGAPCVAGEEPEAFAGRPAPAAHPEPHAGAAGRSARPGAREGRRPIAAQRAVPGRGRGRGLQPGEAGGGAAGEERCVRAVLFAEFLKELAALAQEHAVAVPFPRSQGGRRVTTRTHPRPPATGGRHHGSRPSPPL
ncbi:hypothetical protein AAFF_G00132550 [Aldrovandia affinis]|uniref:FHF complex subunit HOOK-interacting protein 1B n=1 Tax=Aldrovandia affinis TaxID=143900 RepID=A0AAD7W952_9TELE|nr:hypothetical protein AAFF_G00132550 [Aldrovandia affinis]